MKNCLEINFWRKKEHFVKQFVACTFLELQCLVDDLFDFLELSMLINASLYLEYITW